MSGADAALLSQKFSRLLSSLREAESAVLAFSGGVDSAFLLKAMKLSMRAVISPNAIGPMALVIMTKKLMYAAIHSGA